jgi:hypothetical protein
MEWTRALDLAAARMFPSVALRHLLDDRRGRPDPADAAATAHPIHPTHPPHEANPVDRTAGAFR